MEKKNPNPIKSYYIAYFDILGYKEFFQDNPDKVSSFLDMIHGGIQGTKSKISDINNSVLAASIASMNIEVRVFSDNVLLCLEELDVKHERVRLLSFMMMVAEIQRAFITQWHLFVRGGITKGMLSINPDYVFGKGLIDAVTMEETAVYPRIEITNDLIELLFNVSLYTKEDGEKAIAIEQHMANGDAVSCEEHNFYMRVWTAVQNESIFTKLASNLLFLWPDGKRFLSYLFCLDINSFISPEIKEKILDMIKNVFPSDYKFFNNDPVDIGGLLKSHKEIIEGQLKKYGQNDNIELGDIKTADLRERILKKYIWVMAYHNKMCEYYGRIEFKILTKCNCDSRFLKIKIDVLE